MAIALKRAFRPLVVSLAALQSILITALVWAQDKGASVDINATTETTTTTWYGQWWLWAVGAAVFLIVVIALTNRGSRA
jgi:putative copper export protein